ncbi:MULTISPECIES: amidohydrolase [unclassified Herbaspirillum]|uniref:amidohydrolase family protein n=1 Tax=unclassified Herbaspirillum TaxID=2624150 RepID=UPI00115438B2|nr:MULTISPECIES: amidohydrolase family protein [unclassified Herbaspirillum]MBB5390908.1 putative TIM-barrel fold metal-dependent hydrolase [Herbaspirillum sp. SJZ102]TQK06432.1 putative TIM-barrel fold metal-dependent hydrolase [Herbaspirillum sp. SJZ130]TQK12090.1 putative TIM-barrel fold metal-dependent hydrolase [Herbaspirillum sp. SJZ106]
MDAQETTVSPHLRVRQDWLARTAEEALEPALPIVDAHHHLWDRPGGRYLFDELMADIGAGHNVVATVFVQCRSMYRAHGPDAMKPVGEVEFINGLAAQSASGMYGPARACAAIVGFADLMLGEGVQPVLEALLHAGNGRLRGIRNTTAWHADPAIRSNPLPPPPGMLADARFRQGARLLAKYDLPLDVWAYHTQLDEVLALAQACPETRIVLDHAGGPLGAGPYAGRREEVRREWEAAMRRIAAQPNVWLKLGGLGMPVGGWDFHLQEAPPASQQLAAAWRPYIETCIGLFGASRCMFESNFPVDKGMFGYVSLWNAFKRLTQGFGAAERDSLFAGTAREVYRIG